MPVVPGKKATGTKTATSTSEVAMTAPVTSFMASEAALSGLGLALLEVALDVFDHDDHVVDHQAGRQRDAKKRERVDGEAEELDEGEGADE